MIPPSYGRQVTRSELPTGRAETLAEPEGAQDHGPSLGVLFERQVDVRPDAIAVDLGDERIPYAALDARANRLAHHLRRQGAARGTAVGICHGPGLDAIAARLAVVKAGAAYVAVNADDTAQPLVPPQFPVTVGVVLGRGADLARLRGRLPAGVRLVALDDDAALIAAEPDTRPSSCVSGRDVACLVPRRTRDGQVLWELVPHRAVAHRFSGPPYTGPDADRSWSGTPRPEGSGVDRWWAALLHGGTCTVAEDADQAAEPPHEDLWPLHRPAGVGGAFVLDSRLRLLPPGVVGDLYLAGEGLGYGYGDKPSFSAECFVAHPLGNSGERMYRTGERARWRYDGSVELVPQDAEPQPELLLPAKAGGAVAAPAAPRTSRQEILCGIFADMLGLETVGVHDDFFALGGHSILAARIASRVRTLFGVELDLSAVFRGPTVAQLDARISQSEHVRAVLRPVDPRPALLPASPGQQGLWMVDQIQGPNASYNIPIALRLQGALDAGALEAAVNDLVVRHEALRTTFRNHDGAPHQHVIPEDGARVHLERSSCRRSELPDVLAALAGRAFDLGDGPLIRAFLVSLDSDEHVLLLLIHHIVSDGASLDPLLRDLSTAYAARREGEAPRWDRLHVQYVDYALWQRELLGSEEDRDSVLSRQLEYWKSTLAGIPTELDLPAARPRPDTPSFRGDLVPVTVGADLHRGLVALARQQGVTMLMVLQTGLAALLSRLGAGTDVPIGTVVSGRTDEALDRLIGFFTNTLVLRTDLSGNTTITELLDRVRATDLAAFANQNAPFERLVELLNPERAAARHPLFQTMLVLQGRRQSQPNWPDVQVEPVEVGNGTAKFDLSLWLHEDYVDDAPAGLDGSFEYSVDLFDRTTVEDLASRFVRVLEAMATAPDTRLAQVDLLSADERQAVLALSGASADVPATGRIHELFEARARLHPDAIATAHGDRQLRYGELNARANRLGRHLLEAGVTRGTFVGVCLGRGPDLAVAALAVLKTGAACVLLDPTLPHEDIARVLDVTAARVLVTRAGDATCARAETTVSLDQDAAAIDARSAANLDVGGHAGDPACATVTAVAAGRPEVVVTSHQAVVGTCAAPDHHEFGPDDVYLPCSPLSEQTSVTELFGALLHGAQCVLHPGQAPDPAAVELLVARHGVTVLRLPEGLFNRLLDERPAALRGVRYALIGARDASAAHPAKALRDFPDLRVLSGYGPAENTGLTTCHEVVAEGLETSPVPIGVPVTNQRAYVLGPGLELVPVGGVGDLYVAGVGLALGYANRPALTGERFIANPYGSPGERMHRTGRLARRRADGVLELVGPVGEREGPPDPGALPDGGVPVASAGAEDKPRTEREELLCALFEEVLEAVGVGVHDNFFDLGGHSLIASRLVVRIRSQLGIKASVGDVMAAPTVAGLAERLEQAPKVRPRRRSTTPS
ncbi:condensation domain-containing protein [Streptomyces sp. NPDC007905]|uniref:condensation domain-containing protein n=1 Tax=Streptomyces sp. NPDC007905 TaxID=3364788 RepID=UPI0036EB39F4